MPIMVVKKLLGNFKCGGMILLLPPISRWWCIFGGRIFGRYTFGR